MKIQSKSFLLLLLTLICYSIDLSAQIGINKTTSPPDPSAMLDVSSTDKGLLIPRMTGTERSAISNPAKGLMLYVTDEDKFYYNAGTTTQPLWQAIGSQWISTGSDIYYPGGGVGIGGIPDPSAILDASAIDKGILVPRMSLAQRDGILNPAQGLIIFCNDPLENTFYYNAGLPSSPDWREMRSKWSRSGNNIYYNSGNVGIGTSTPGFRLSLDNSGGIIAKGTFGSGQDLLTSGEGTRFVWNPKRSTLHAGYLESWYGDYWDDYNTADYSVAMGCSSRASGVNSLSIGYDTEIDTGGVNSASFGSSWQMQLPNSILMGYGRQVYLGSFNGPNHFAVGPDVTIYDCMRNGSVLGQGTITYTQNSTILGYGDIFGWQDKNCTAIGGNLTALGDNVTNFNGSDAREANATTFGGSASNLNATNFKASGGGINSVGFGTNSWVALYVNYVGMATPAVGESPHDADFDYPRLHPLIWEVGLPYGYSSFQDPQNLVQLSQIRLRENGRMTLNQVPNANNHDLINHMPYSGLTRTPYLTPSIRNTMHVNGSIAVPVKSVTNDYAVTDSDNVILCNGTGITVTLPDATTCAARYYTIKNKGTSAVSIASSASQTIDGQASVSLNSQYRFITVISSGISWFIVSDN